MPTGRVGDHGGVNSHYRRVAVLGSSFAAGPGIDPIIDRFAGRSERNYGHLVAARLGAELSDLTVSGATTETLLETEQRVGWRRFPPQVQGLSADTDLVMITAGGNDLGYIGSMMKASIAGALRSRRVIGALMRRIPMGDVAPAAAADVERAADGLARVVAAVRGRAPSARVLLASYPTVIGPDTTIGAQLPIRAQDLEPLSQLGEAVTAAFARAASAGDAELIKVAEAGRDHGIGSTEPWVNGFRPVDGDGSRFHPNAAGMRGIAELIMEQLD